MTESAKFYENESKGLGSNFLDEIEHSVSLVCKSPEIAQKSSGEIRRFVLARFPYSLIYVEEEKEILILAVAHHKREPGYWKNR